MDQQYCIKCKKPTPSINTQIVITKNGRTMRKATCAACGTVKTQFVKSK